MISDLLAELSEPQQEIITGGADFELAGSNYANRVVVLRGSVASGPYGSFANSSGQSSQINTAAQDFLGLGVPSIPNFPALGTAPVLTDLPAELTTGLTGLGRLPRLGTSPDLGNMASNFRANG